MVDYDVSQIKSSLNVQNKSVLFIDNFKMILQVMISIVLNKGTEVHLFY